MWISVDNSVDAPLNCVHKSAQVVLLLNICGSKIRSSQPSTIHPRYN